MRIKVTDKEGSPISFARASVRHFGQVPSGLILGVGYFMAGWTERKQALHDLLARCLVVNTRSTHERMIFRGGDRGQYSTRTAFRFQSGRWKCWPALRFQSAPLSLRVSMPGASRASLRRNFSNFYFLIIRILIIRLRAEG